MDILKDLDPEGVACRRSKYLKRRSYYNKVYLFDRYVFKICFQMLVRAPTMYGTWMGTTSLLLTASVYTDA